MDNTNFYFSLTFRPFSRHADRRAKDNEEETFRSKTIEFSSILLVQKSIRDANVLISKIRFLSTVTDRDHRESVELNLVPKLLEFDETIRQRPFRYREVFFDRLYQN